MKVFISLALIAGGLLMALFFAYDRFWYFFGTEGLEILDYLYLGSPIILSLAVAFVGWRLYKKAPKSTEVEKAGTKSKTGLFLVLLGTGIAFFPALMTIRQLPYDPLTTPYLDIIWMFLTLPIGGVIAIIGLVQRADGKPRKMRAPIAKPDQSAGQVQALNEVQAVDQTPSTMQSVLIAIAVFIGFNVCFGSISSFMNVNLHPSWAIFGAIQFLAGAALIYWGIRRLKKK